MLSTRLPRPSSRSQGKSRMVAGTGPLDTDVQGEGEGEEGSGMGQDAGTRGQGAGQDAGSDGDPDHPTALGAAGAGAHGAGAGDPGSDSSEDERPNRNTVGAVPLEWYQHEEHIGYDIEGRAIAKSGKKDRLQQLLDRNDSKKVGWEGEQGRRGRGGPGLQQLLGTGAVYWTVALGKAGMRALRQETVGCAMCKKATASQARQRTFNTHHVPVGEPVVRLYTGITAASAVCPPRAMCRDGKYMLTAL